MTQTNTVLKHIVGKESKIVVKKSKEVNNTDFFYSQYSHAIKVAEKIVKNARIPEENDEEAKEAEKKSPNLENINNIIAFIGERGSGKTSCMLTFANILVEGHETIKFENTDSKANFYQLPALDPSFFSEDYNIIGAYIASIYKEVKAYSKRGNISQGKLQDFYASLADAQRSFGRLSAPDKDRGDDLERLEQLSCSMKLKEDLHYLTERFLECVNHSKGTVLLCIDDIDLNTKTAVDMVEWIRKYLIQPNIMILFAVKLDQLINLKRLSLLIEYKELIKKEMMAKSELDEMAERYIVKLFPMVNRVYMPNMSNLPFVQYRRKNIIGDKEKEGEIKVFREAIVEEIYKKTGYSFFNSYFTTNLVVPGNLREALQLMRLLTDMQEPNNQVITIENQQTFQEYLLHDYLRKQLDTKSIGLIKELENVIDASQFNATIIRIIRAKFDLLINERFKNASSPNDYIIELRNIFKTSNYSYNISLGDVMGVMKWIESVSLDQEETYFMFAIKTIMHIRLLQSSQTLKETVNKTSEHEGPYTYTKFERSNISDFHQVLAGQIFNPHLVPFIQNNCATISDRKVNITEFFNTIDYNDENDCRVSEFVMLCISGPISRTNSDRDYRCSDIIRYHSTFSGNSQFAIFDYYAILYNITDIATCYNRFIDLIGKDNWKKIVDSPAALWREILLETDSLYKLVDEEIVLNHNYFPYGAQVSPELYFDLFDFCSDKRRMAEGEEISRKMIGFAKIIDLYNQPRHKNKSKGSTRLLKFNLEDTVKKIISSDSFKPIAKQLDPKTKHDSSVDSICSLLFEGKSKIKKETFQAYVERNRDQWNSKEYELIVRAGEQAKTEKFIRTEKFITKLREIDTEQLIEKTAMPDENSFPSSSEANSSEE